ncbi:hypothetical protein EI77_03086 [Prosthecobacter fusiformis]|uniref:Uncharacterized protein n=1 Tax=Prosthecobacter fusiformis TaxID=48464 RepID=A0A4R7RUL0_9BACT|nr:hypothetical protein [Prosthecobacter fusiformis]TDU69432.1 hypothetical protein EI77_03086 [Prosthecobacter fusiformis]
MNASPKIRQALLLTLAWAIVALACPLYAESEPPLPTWDSGESIQPSPGSNFSNLLPESSSLEPQDSFYLGSPAALKSPPLLLDEPGLDSHDLSLFLHGGLLNETHQPAKVSPTPSLALQDIPESILAGLQNVPVNEYLINPQGLLTEVPLLDLERLLQFHSTESRIRLYILVIGRDQKLSSAASLNPLIARLGAGRELCLAVYPVGEPWRTRFLVSPSLSQASSLGGMTEMAEDCIQDSLLVNDPEQQLQRFAVKLSTRLFWLEKSLPPLASTISQEGKANILHEVAPSQGFTVPAIVYGEGAGIIQTVGISVGCVLFLAVMGYGVRSLLRYFAARRIRHVWILPETEVRPRLGGAFSGGAGAVMQHGPKSR